MNRDYRNADDALTRSLPSASEHQVDAALARIHAHLQSDRGETEVPPLTDVPGSTFRSRWPVAIAASLLIASVGAAMLWRSADDPLFRVLEGDVTQGETIRSNGGAMLALADGSRIEMRSRSELAFERAADGVRIRLRRGGVIVNAARQRTGHLYVETKDMTVSVVGTVFVVNADDDGSRVAVIEGEVRVQQGATVTQLRPGERVATSPKVEVFSAASDLAWSRRAADLTALLQRQAAVQLAWPVLQAPKDPRSAFETVSIRPSGSPPGPPTGARGGAGGANSRPLNGCVVDSFGYMFQLDPRRFAVTRATLLHLVSFTVPNVFNGEESSRADLNCLSLTKLGLLSGGPDWIRNDVWDVTATIPQGGFTTTPSLTDPVLQQMLRAMLVERFGLVMRRETREQPVYLLKVGKDGPKFNGRYRDPGGRDVLQAVGVTDADDGCRESTGRDDGNSRYFSFKACNMSMARLAADLSASLERPVLDQTGLPGRFAFFYGYFDPNMVPQLAAIGGGSEPRPRQEKAIEGIGLRVEESRAPIDVWVIERAEKPTDN